MFRSNLGWILALYECMFQPIRRNIRPVTVENIKVTIQFLPKMSARRFRADKFIRYEQMSFESERLKFRVKFCFQKYTDCVS